MTYAEFLDRKAQIGTESGFEALWIPDWLYDFQKSLLSWSIKKGRCAILADCGLGKTPIELAWAENVIRKTAGRVLILTPLAVSYQHLREAAKFGVECHRSTDGKPQRNITVTNYQRLHLFSSDDFIGVICDEASALKSFSGQTRKLVTEFTRKTPYRLLATATAAPNDYIELGTLSEALGELGQMEMLARFFKNDENCIKSRKCGRWAENGQMRGPIKFWRLKGHAEIPFWRWVASWARACRRPSDLGFYDGRFILPPLIENQHLVKANTLPDGMLFQLPAIGLDEQRDERRRTIKEGCEKVAELVTKNEAQSLMWCHLNPEGDLLEKTVPDCKQVKGSDPDEEKEETLVAFANGQLKNLVTKEKIAAWGLNFQRCAHITFFPSHSFEGYYQGIRRCWRFGQTKPVVVDIVTTEGEANVTANLQRKAAAADRMFTSLVAEMNQATHIKRTNPFTQEMEIPSWL